MSKSSVGLKTMALPREDSSLLGFDPDDGSGQAMKGFKAHGI